MERVLGVILFLCLSGIQGISDVPALNDEYANCTVYGPSISIPQSFLSGIGIDLGKVLKLILAEEPTSEVAPFHCTATLENGNYVFTPTGSFGSCSYLFETTTIDDCDFYELRYRIRILLNSTSGQIVSHGPAPAYIFVCFYKVNSHDTSGPYLPVAHQQDVYVDPELEDFDICMSIYPNSSYDTALLPPYSTTIGDTVYVQVDIKNELGNFVLQARQCWASASRFPEDTPRYQLISEGCAAIDPNGMQNVFVGRNFMSDNVTFWFNSFRWLDNDVQRVFLHCTLFVCVPELEENCTLAPNCGAGRRRRDITMEKPQANEKTVTIGPIDLSKADKKNSAKINAQSPSTKEPLEQVIQEKSNKLCDAVALGCSHDCGTTSMGDHVCVCPSYNTIDTNGKTCHHVIEDLHHNNLNDVRQNQHSGNFLLPACFFVSALLSCAILMIRFKA